MDNSAGAVVGAGAGAGAGAGTGAGAEAALAGAALAGAALAGPGVTVSAAGCLGYHAGRAVRGVGAGRSCCRAGLLATAVVMAAI